MSSTHNRQKKVPLTQSALILLVNAKCSMVLEAQSILVFLQK